MLQWIKRSVARQAGVIVAGSLSSVTLGVWLLGRFAVVPAFPASEFVIGVACVVPATGIFAAWVTQRLVGSRLAHLVEVIDGAGPHDDLARIRHLGEDEVGAIAQAVNGLLARITSIRASMIDQKRALGEAQRELELTTSLAAKTAELAQRREERAMLFDILRMTTSSPELSVVLNTLVERVAQLLRFREAVLCLYDEPSQTLAVDAAHGFVRPDALRGRSIKLGEGISGKVGATRAALVIDDLGDEPQFLGFWGEAERTGSLAAVPILYQDQLLGVLTVTRAEPESITEVHVKLLSAIADNAALAIRNAQLFERMRALSTHDELTGLPNRRLLQSHLVREIDRARRFEKAFTLLAIEAGSSGSARAEADNGDSALCGLAQVFGAHIRKFDTLARVDSRRFMVLLPSADVREASAMAQKLRDAASAYPPFATSEQHDKLVLRVGIVQLQADDDERGETLMERAEQALASGAAGSQEREHGEPLAALPNAQHHLS